MDTRGSRLGRLGIFFISVERLGFYLSAGLFQQNFDSAFSFFKLLLAFARKRHAFFEEFHRFVEREIRAFKALDDFLEPPERSLKIAFFRCFDRLISRWAQLSLAL